MTNSYDADPIMKLPDWVPDICIYHGNCMDGFTAAWVIAKKWPDIEFYGASHGSPIDIDVCGKNVLMVDFAPKLRDMGRWQVEPKSLVILDHHKTAEADLANVYKFKCGPKNATAALAETTRNGKPPIVAWFDMDKSGAHLAWLYAFIEDRDPTMFANVPPIVTYVEDRDLWLFRHKKTKPFTAFLSSAPMSFKLWDVFANPANEDDIIDKGRVILQTEQSIRDGLKKEVYPFTFEMEPPRDPPPPGSHWGKTSYVVPVVNAPYHFASELANEILLEHPDAPFAACWFRRADGKVQWSLRSADERVDVSQIAKKMGGGGHRNASGFECYMGDMPANLIWVPA